MSARPAKDYPGLPEGEVSGPPSTGGRVHVLGSTGGREEKACRYCGQTAPFEIEYVKGGGIHLLYVCGLHLAADTMAALYGGDRRQIVITVVA